MKVRVDPAAAREVAAAHADAPTTRQSLVAAASTRLVAEPDRLCRQLTAPDRPHRLLRRSITAALHPQPRPTGQSKGSP